MNWFLRLGYFGRALGFVIATSVLLWGLLPQQARATDFVLNVQGGIDGSDLIRVEPDRAIWVHRHWSSPTSVTFNGMSWQPQQQPILMPGGKPLIPSDLENYRASIIRTSGRDEITAEIKEDHVLIQVADSPDGGGLYQFQVVLSPRLVTSSPSAELKVRGRIDGSGRLRIDANGASWLNRYYQAPSSLSLNGIVWNPTAQ